VGNLIVVLGDQLDPASPLLRDLASDDLVWMAELPEEANHVCSHKARIVLFLSAMRHFRDSLLAAGVALRYLQLGEHGHDSFGQALGSELRRRTVSRIRVLQPGDYRVLSQLRAAADQARIPLEVHPDPHFLCTPDEFDAWASGRRELRLEHFYRHMRRRCDVLMEGTDPRGGKWNFDRQNRRSFGRAGPGRVPAPKPFPPDPITRQVMDTVSRTYADHPGNLDAFDWPVTRGQASVALDDFLDRRLPGFGDFQDAMWVGHSYLYHSRLAAAMNLRLLNPGEVIDGALARLESGNAPLNAVEGFVRQILGWREYVRGIYWRHMPDYARGNALDAHQSLPAFYWSGETDMACLRHTIGQTLNHGYAHHIQRLMVTGLFALLLGVRPSQVHAWYLAVYVDAVEWVEMPNTLGMSQYADGGLMASKPYAASGRYIQRMSNYCSGCGYDPARAQGTDACPFTTLYWDFLRRHRQRFARHPRTALQWRNLERLDEQAQRSIADQATALRRSLETNPELLD
jgi:deoxyribodipyrimidine photolyase-related protein